MKATQFIEKYFGIFLAIGLVSGLVYPVFNDFLFSLLEPFLMVMLFLVFLKTDIAGIFRSIKNYRFMAFLVLMLMLAIPALFYLLTNIVSNELAVGILLLTAMPAGAATPALTDIVKGNTALSTSIVVTTSIIAPVTVPFLFWALKIDNLSIDPWLIFKNLALLILLPMIASQVIKKYLPGFARGGSHLFSSINIFLLSLMVYAIMGSQRGVILGHPELILWQTGFLYLVFILLHIFGFFIGYGRNKKDRIATAVSSAYMNNGMAIVLAAVYFEPSILVLMVLSEIPWNTLLMPFRKIVN